MTSEIAAHSDRAVERERAWANSVAATIRLSGGGVFLLLSLALWQFAGLWDWGVYAPLLALYTALAVPAYVFRRHLVAFGGLIAVADVVIVYVLQRQALPVSPFPAGVAGFSLGVFALLVSLGSLTLSSATGFAVAGISTIAQLALMHQAGVSQGPMVAAAIVLLLIAVIGHTNLVRLRIVCADLAQTEAACQTEHRRFAEIEHAGQTIERRLREAQEVIERLGQVQRDKEALLQTLVHDMRSPLTDILVSLDSLAEAPRPDLALHDALDDAKVAAKRVARMVSEMLDVAKLEEGRLVLERSGVHLDHLVETVRKQSEPLASERAVSIDVECEEASTVEVDRGLMTRVLENLVSNAIRHAPRGDRVLIALRADPGSLLISVHNNGVPIPHELRHQVFEKFVRADGDSERRPGWGLGLFFCRLALDAHGGSIAVEDVPGWSTSLVIRLPRTPRAAWPVDQSTGGQSTYRFRSADAIEWAQRTADRARDLQKVSAQLRDAAGVARAESEMRRSEARRLSQGPDIPAAAGILRQLHDLTMRFVRDSDLPGLLKDVLDVAIRVTGANLGNIQLLDPASNELRIVAQRGFGPAFLDFFDRVEGHGAACGTALARRERIVVEDVATSALYSDEARAVMKQAAVAACHSTPLITSGGDVIGIVSVHFHERRRLADHEARLLDRFAQEAADIIDLGRARVSRLDVEAALAREQAANRARDDFLAILTHELRNALGVIENGIACLDRHGARGEAAVRTRELMHRQSEHVARLLDDLLDLARIGQGNVVLHPVSLDLRATVGQAVAAERMRADAKAQRLTMTCPDEPIQVMADPTRMLQVVENLLHNAIKYTPRGGSIAVALGRDGDEAVLRVVDDGIGIPPEQLTTIFDLFTQVDPGLDATVVASERGIGVGLALVQRLVRLHGGTVQAHSAGRGKGSQFVVRLPLST